MTYTFVLKKDTDRLIAIIDYKGNYIYHDPRATDRMWTNPKNIYVKIF